MKKFSTPLKGMILDLDSINLDENSYTYALNALLESNTGDGYILQNDTSNILGAVLASDENVIGKKFIVELDKIILFTTNNRILLLSAKLFNDAEMNSFDYNEGSIPLSADNNTPVLEIQEVASSSCFNWSIQHKVDIEHKITDTTLNLYFVDGGYNEDRYIYLNLSDFSVEQSFRTIIGIDSYKRPIYSNQIDCNTLKWYPEISYPTIKTRDVDGGNLKAGVYQFLVGFSTSKGVTLTNYKAATNPFPLFTKKVTDITDYNTGKGIEITVGDLPITGRYRYINLAVAETINEITTYKLIGTFPIVPVLYYTYTGDGKATPLDETDLFQIYPFYKSSNGVTKSNNRLFKFGIRDFEKFNLQQFVNKLRLKWYTIIAEEGEYLNPEFAQNYRGYMRDEVYTFGLKFILDNGQETQVYPFIGREATLADNHPILANKDTVVAEENCKDPKPFSIIEKWKVYNTATVTKTVNTSLNNCEYLQYQEGEFSYWQSTETYPNEPEVWGSQAGQSIKHFKYPDCLVSPIQNGNPVNKLEYEDKNLMYPIGVKLSDDSDVESILQEAVNLSYITQQQKDRIRGYKIVRGNRVGNESIIAKGWMGSVWAYNDKGKTTHYANHGFNDLRRDPYLLNQDLSTFNDSVETRSPNKAEYFPDKKYTFNSPDTSFRQPSLGEILKIENEIFGTARGFFSESKSQAEYVILNQLQYNFAIMIAWVMTSELNLEDNAQPATQGQAIGSGIGGIIGGVVGAVAGGVGAPVGAAIGSGIGGIIGKLVAGNTANNAYNAMYRLNMWISQTDRILELLQNTIPLQNYHWQYQAVGKYVNTDKVTNSGFKQRRIINSAYLDGTRHILPNDVFFNHNDRESTVYIEIDEEIARPKYEDKSKFIASEVDNCFDEYEEVDSDVSTFYGSIKREILNQYGNIHAVEWLPVSNKVWKTGEKFTEFGGDSYIGRFAFKRSHSFFTNTMHKMPDRTEVYYEDAFNIAFPMYFFNTKYTELAEPKSITMSVINALPIMLALNNLESPESFTKNYFQENAQDKGVLRGVQDNVADLFKVALLNPYNITRPGRQVLDCSADNFFEKPIINIDDPSSYRRVPFPHQLFKDMKNLAGIGSVIPNTKFNFSAVKGKIYTYNHAIPYFMCESIINLDMRYAEEVGYKDFYPNQTNLRWWLQEDNVNPRLDNVYTYNRSYSKQNKEELSLKPDVNFYTDLKKTYYQNRVIYSQEGAEVENSDFRDNYLYYKPLDSKDFSFENGKLISVDSIESNNILLRFENNLGIIQASQTLRTQQGVDIALGNGGVFNLYQEFAKTEQGYLGSQHTELLSTEFGHIFVDAKRGAVFSVQSSGKGVDELSKNGVRSWMAENLPFNISRYFPEVNVDNTYNNIGLTLSYDKRYKRFFITKLDYLPVVSGITYSNGKFWYRGLEVDLRDTKYFCNASWTISYSFYKQTWTSFHSFTPNYYIDGITTFITGLNGVGKGLSSLWVHNLTNKNFQTYYNKLQPFEIECTGAPSIPSKVLNDVSFSLEVFRYHNKYDKSYVDDVIFNKAIVFNDKQNSGLLELNLINEDDLYSIVNLPLKEHDRTQIAVKANESVFSFNQFTDITHNNNLPRFINSCNNVKKVLNLNSLNYSNLKVDNDYIRGQKAYVRLINDKEDKYKFVFRGLLIDELPSVI